jgi:hypothetical protein
LLKTYCWKCHGGEGFEAALDFRSLPLILKGGKNGKVIEPGSAEKSLLYQKLAAKEMPPGNALKPTDAHMATIKAWIDAGAPGRYAGGPLTDEEDPPLTDDDRNWWAFRKIVRREPPVVKQVDRVRTPIDAFLLARLDAKGLSFSPDADRAALLRRVYFDLVGLPPAPEEIDRFLADTAADAYDRLIDRLLASPHYGERWGRHWLDAARYADSNGYSIDAPRSIWRYRDWVIDALNRDLPFDQFVIEQLAGDLLPPGDADRVIATGFLMVGAKALAETDKEQSRLDIVDDQIDTIGRSFLHCGSSKRGGSIRAFRRP